MADLTASWQRYDWRESFFAPQIAILQALTLNGATASGVGLGRESALQRCLGETAEIYALACDPKLRAEFKPLRDGLAAHEEPQAASDAAFLEAVERHGVIDWWLGRRLALRLSGGWQDQQGLTHAVETARSGAAVKRLTGFWLIEGEGPAVVICHSSSPRGQNHLLGFGAAPDPAAAARKALREMFLVEMNLMELMADGHSGANPALARLDAQIASYTRRCPALLQDRQTISPPIPANGAAASRDWPVAAFRLVDVTPEGSPLSVWHCRPDLPVPSLDEGTGTPFF